MRKLGSIELDQSVYMEAKIYLYDTNGFLMDTIRPKWEKRFDVFKKINENFTKGLLNEKDRKG